MFEGELMVDPVGLEPIPISENQPQNSSNTPDGAQIGALEKLNPSDDDDPLIEISRLWPFLSDDVKKTIFDIAKNGGWEK